MNISPHKAPVGSVVKYNGGFFRYRGKDEGITLSVDMGDVGIVSKWDRHRSKGMPVDRVWIKWTKYEFPVDIYVDGFPLCADTMYFKNLFLVKKQMPEILPEELFEI